MSLCRKITWIYSFWFVVMALAGFTNAHDKNVELLNELNASVADIEVGQKDIRFGVKLLKEFMHEELDKLKENEESHEQIEPEVPEDPASDPKVKNFIDRLDKLEMNIEAIESYIHGERDTDTFLNGLRGDIGKAFDNDMLQVKNFAENMRQELKGSFVNVDKELGAVEDFANSRNVIIGGVQYYDGIGAACGPSFDVCRVERSECRDGKYQCEPGLSHDSLHEKCVETCTDGYGDMYQHVKNYIIRGHNKLTINATNLDECMERCETDGSFECRSFDFFPRWSTCYLSDVVKGDVEDKAWEYNSEGIHFQRDCIVDKQANP